MVEGRRTAVAVGLLLAAAVAGVGCSSGGSGGAGRVGATTTTQTARANPFRQTTVEAAACSLERSVLTNSVSTYQALNGRYPTSAAELVAAHVLTQASSLYRVESRVGRPPVLIPTFEGVREACQPKQL